MARAAVSSLRMRERVDALLLTSCVLSLADRTPALLHCQDSCCYDTARNVEQKINAQEKD